MADVSYRCCEHCADDVVHDIPPEGHVVPCTGLGEPCREGRLRAKSGGDQ